MMISPRHYALAIILAAIFTAPVAAQSSSWMVDADGNWGTSSNWNNGVPNGVGYSVFFSSNQLTADRTITLDIAPTISNLTFNVFALSPSTTRYILDGGNAITFQTS